MFIFKTNFLPGETKPYEKERFADIALGFLVAAAVDRSAASSSALFEFLATSLASFLLLLLLFFSSFYRKILTLQFQIYHLKKVYIFLYIDWKHL